MHPEGYHGHGVTSSYFEGWYVKVVSADRSARYAVIPGVFLAPDGTGEAFVFTAGSYVHAIWSRNDRLEPFTLTADDGSVVALTPGRTFIELPRVGHTLPLPAQ